MIDPKNFEQMAKQLTDAMPAPMKAFAQDMESKTKDVLQAQFAKLDLITREEFDVQSQVLLRTREKLQALEAKVAELEEKLTK